MTLTLATDREEAGRFPTARSGEPPQAVRRSRVAAPLIVVRRFTQGKIRRVDRAEKAEISASPPLALKRLVPD
jgi:hypothetical protein